MQRKPTPQSRGIRAVEKRHMHWIKNRCICAACGKPGPVINHHFLGSARKLPNGLERVFCGHWAVVGLCQRCDDLVTFGSPKKLSDQYGPVSDMWFRQIEEFPEEVPLNVMAAIGQWGK
jgi:hypothetical protein